MQTVELHGTLEKANISKAFPLIEFLSNNFLVHKRKKSQQHDHSFRIVL